MTVNDEYESGMEKAISQIAAGLRYNKELVRLMQSTRVNNQEQWKFAVLFALNEGKLKSKVISDFLFGYLGLANSLKGKSREEQIDLVKAATPSVPKGIIGRIKETFDLE